MRVEDRPASTSTRGFTLIELLIAIGLVAILLAVAAPSLTEAMMNVRMSAQVNDFMSDLSLARSEAAKRNLTVFVCASRDRTSCNSNSWNTGWVVFPDLNNNNLKDPAEPVLKSRAALEGDNTLRSAGHVVQGSNVYLPYGPSGASTAGTITNFVFCDSRTSPNTGRRIQINAVGRPQINRETCPTDP